jgi:hypothetical protein
MVAVQTHRRAELAADILSTFGLSPTPTPTPVRGTTIDGLAYGGQFVDSHGEGGQGWLRRLEGRDATPDV